MKVKSFPLTGCNSCKCVVHYHRNMISLTSNKFWGGKNAPLSLSLRSYFFFLIVSRLLLTVARSFGLNSEHWGHRQYRFLGLFNTDLVFGSQAVRSHIFLSFSKACSSFPPGVMICDCLDRRNHNFTSCIQNTHNPICSSWVRMQPCEWSLCAI